MPHLWNNNIVVVTVEELVPMFYNSINTLYSNIQRYKDKPYGIKRVQIGGNGRPSLISFDSLPIEMREALGDPRKCSHILERFYKIDGEAVKFFSDYRFTDKSSLSMEYQEQYIVNASVIRAVLLLKEARETERRNKGGSMVGILGTLCSDAASFNQVLHTKHKVQHTLPESLRRFRETLAEFQARSYASLVSGKFKTQNARKVTDVTLHLLNSMFATDRTKPTATEIARRYELFIKGHAQVINNETGEEYNPAEFKTLSKATVTNYLAEWKSAIGTHANRSGDRQKYMQQYKTPHALEKPKFAGSIISIDDRQPPFKCMELDGKRIWFYNAIDLGSEAFTCWVHGFEKEGIILDFYRQLVRNYAEWGLNLPHELECEKSLNDSFKNTFLREGAMFQQVRVEANNARGKRIERYYGELRYRYEKKREGWLARPFALSESNQKLVKDLKEIKSLPYSTIVEGCLQDIETWNNTPHSVYTDKTRWEVFMEMQHPNVRPTNYAAILPHLGFKTQTSCNQGQIRLQGGLFLLGDGGKLALGQDLIRLMKEVEGQDLDIYWLDGNDGQVLKAMVYARGGTRYLCEAIAKPSYSRASLEQTPEDEANRQLMSSYVATIDAYGRQQKRSIEPITFIDNTPQRTKTFVMKSLQRRETLYTDSDEPKLLPPLPDEDDFTSVPVVATPSMFDRF